MDGIGTIKGISDTCLESYPCQHSVDVVCVCPQRISKCLLLNGREIYRLLQLPQNAKFKETNPEIVKHFEKYV